MDTSSKPPLKQNSLRKQFAKAFAEELVTTPLPPLDYSFPEPEYDADGIAGADYHFVQELIAVATPPTTSDAPKNVVSELRGLANAPNSLLQKVLHILQDPPAPHAVTLATSHEQLDKALSCKFSFIKLSPGLVDLHGWTLEKQIASMGQGTGQAYQPAKKMTKHGETTHNVTSAVLPGFLNPDAQAPDERGTNILDMANLSGHRFYPDAILEQSLVHQIRLQFFKGSWSRSAQQGWESLKNEFMILTNGGVVSPIHCDQGGRVAYLFVIDGCKFWYGTKGQWAEVQKEFQLNGPRCPHYRSGMFGIQLRRGDALYVSTFPQHLSRPSTR